ncbi:hypothetical protein PAE3239 [Pyrobaculum aerophilum str. IM2]|uniref:Uncharacterized protein n=1 Tax=Pyrobaculum aerophilum (strain ATCC 51768 / DSM 7523 / JCM 9630 / CIP 104966 / NBRC 100827 / IM2) TaxID=178306 RepID=Q8ZTI4_PYRAE|nr:hypothetical protein PAE3239 [Pyrobaculum aerophilum str. IM2]
MIEIGQRSKNATLGSCIINRRAPICPPGKETVKCLNNSGASFTYPYGNIRRLELLWREML